LPGRAPCGPAGLPGREASTSPRYPHDTHAMGPGPPRPSAEYIAGTWSRPTYAAPAAALHMPIHLDSTRTQG